MSPHWWVGDLEIGEGRTLRLVATITETPNGLSGTLTSPVQDAEAEPFDSITRKDRQVEFRID